MPKKEKLNVVMKDIDGKVFLLEGDSGVIGCLTEGKNRKMTVDVRFSVSNKHHLLSLLTAILLELDRDESTGNILDSALALLMKHRENPHPVKKRIKNN